MTFGQQRQQSRAFGIWNAIDHEYRYMAAWIEAQKFRRLLRVRLDIDEDKFERNGKFDQQPVNGHARRAG